MDILSLDLNAFRAVLTFLLFLTFVGLCVLMIMRGSKGYDAAAEIPFKEFDKHE